MNELFSTDAIVKVYIVHNLNNTKKEKEKMHVYLRDVHMYTVSVLASSLPDM